MHIEIDTGRCIGSGQCARTAPGVFTQDDDGLSTLLPGASATADTASVREAARACPVGAIAVGAART
ncbi:ferredoxin [Streptomyces sp. NPDC048603]|uniref:ferredoxin n=1 Tax=Streptomyces sp. NPDC048603 TaxID=3365577 RepID=UPI00371FCB19